MDPVELLLGMGAGMKRRPVRQACSHCASAHLSCSDVRPCERCERRGLQCTERQRKRRRVDGQLLVTSPIPSPPLRTAGPQALPLQAQAALHPQGLVTEDVHARSLAILSAYRQAREQDVQPRPAPSACAPAPSTLPGPSASPAFVLPMPPEDYGVTLKASSGDMFHVMNTEHPVFADPMHLEWGLRAQAAQLGQDLPPPAPSFSSFRPNFSFAPLGSEPAAKPALSLAPLDNMFAPLPASDASALPSAASLLSPAAKTQ